MHKYVSNYFLILIIGILFEDYARSEPLDGLKPAAGFLPSIQFVERFVETVETFPDPETGEYYREVWYSHNNSITLTANLTGTDLGDVGPNTSISITFGELSLQGTLGDDPTYTEANRLTRRNVFIPFEMGSPGDGVRLSWSASRLTVTIKNAEIACAGKYLDAGGTFSIPIRDRIPVSIEFGGIMTSERDVYLSGNLSSRVQKFGSIAWENYEEYDLDSVSLSGSFDNAAPTNSIISPKINSTVGSDFTIMGRCSDGHGISRVEYSRSRDALEWNNADSLEFLPPALPEFAGENIWGTSNRQWSFTLSGQPYGTHRVWVRAVDLSGNISTPAMITLIRPYPPLLRDRWDGLANATETGKPGLLSIVCTPAGIVTGRYFVEGLATPLSFTGALYDNQLIATIRPGWTVMSDGKPTRMPLILKGNLEGIEPSAATETSINFTLGVYSSESGTDESIILPLAAGVLKRSPYSSANRLPSASPALNRFNASLLEDPEEDSSRPSGHSYYSFLVSNSGVVNVSGRCADGANFLSSTVLGAGGEIPIFALLYANRGSFSAMPVVSLTSQEESEGYVMCSWRRPPAFSDLQYPNGFNIDRGSNFSRYLPPRTGQRVMSLKAAIPNARACWYGERAPIQNGLHLTISSSNFVDAQGAAGFTATVLPATGLLSGTLFLPGETRPTPWNAIIQGDHAFGHYIGQPAPRSTIKAHGLWRMNGILEAPGGMDDFNDNVRDPTLWATRDQSQGGAVFQEIGGRLEIVVRSKTTKSSSSRDWNSGFATLDQEFVLEVDVFNKTQPINSTPKPSASIGITIYNTANRGDNVQLQLYRDGGSNGFYYLLTLSQNGIKSPIAVRSLHTSQSGTLRLHYNPATKVITAFSSSNDLPMGSFGLQATGGITDNAIWSLSADPYLGTSVTGNIEQMAVTSGELFVDNFTLSQL